MLALTAALVGPYFVDWTSYRSDFEREASRILGRKVTVAGEASARILPFPSVTFTNVEVAGETTDKPSMTVETFSMDAELAPFMRGEFLIFDMRLHKPVMTIDVADNGLIDWTIRPNTPFDASEVTLEKISVTEGRVTVQHAAGRRSYLLERINADISAQTLAGPWRASGELDFDGFPMSAMLSTGPVGNDGKMRLRLKVNPTTLPIELETDGNVRIADGGAIYSGLFRLEAASADEAEEEDEDAAFSISIEKQDEAVIPFRVTGDFTVDHRLVDVAEFLFETGSETDPYSAEGTAYLDFGERPNFSVQVKGQQVRFEADANMAGGARPLASRIDAFRELVQQLPKPRFPGTLNVDLPAIVTGDTTIRQVKLAAQPNEGGWNIEAFSAELPGRSTLEAEGLLTTGSDFGFHGTMLLAVNQPSGFAAWLSDDVDEAIRRLPAAGFSASVDINGQRQAFRDLELILGSARFLGEIDHLVPADARPSMLLRLEGGALDVDGLAAFASIFVNDAGAARFSDHDLDFVIKAGPVTAGGLTAGSIDTALRLKDGLLDIDRLSIGDLAGSTVSATGKLKNFPSSPTGNLDASIVSVDLEPLVRLLAARYPENLIARGLADRAGGFPGLLTDTRIDLVASAAANDDGSIGLAISAHGESGGSRFTVSGSGAARQGAIDGPLSVTLTMQNDDAAPVFAVYGLPALPLNLTGPAETSVTIAGKVGGQFETKLLLRGEDIDAAFDGWAGFAEGRRQATGQFRIKSGDIEPWLATAGVTLPGYGYGLQVDIKSDISHRNHVLELGKLTGNLDGNPITADLVADFSTETPAVSGALVVPSLDLHPLALMLLGENGLKLDAEGRPGSAPFAPAAELAFTTDVALTVARLDFGGDHPLEEARLKLDVNEDRIRISDLQATYRGGSLSGLMDLQNNNGTALLSTQFNYAGTALSEYAATEAVGGKITVSADLTANGKSLAGLMSSLSGSGTVSLADAVLPGINPGVFDALINAADDVGKDIDSEDVAAFAKGLVSSGSYRAGDADFTFVLAGGVLRTPSIMFPGPPASLDVELNADFNNWTAAAKAEITYDPGREALVGAIPAVRIEAAGPIGSVTADYDTGPLAQFLTQRALELEQLRVESLQAGLLEKQRLRREVRYYAELEKARVGNSDNQTGEGTAVLPENSDDHARPTLEPAAENLEDSVRRILDEEARKREEPSADEVEQQRAAAAVNGVVTIEPLPDISQTETAGETDSDPAASVFETLRDDRMTIDTFLRSIDP